MAVRDDDNSKSLVGVTLKSDPGRLMEVSLILNEISICDNILFYNYFGPFISG